MGYVRLVCDEINTMRTFIFGFGILVTFTVGHAKIISVGAGSYTTNILDKSRDYLPINQLNVTSGFKGAAPTNTWTGGVVWGGVVNKRPEEPIYPLPLALQFVIDPNGLIGGLHITQPTTMLQNNAVNTVYYQQGATPFDLTFMPSGYDDMQLAQQGNFSATFRMFADDKVHSIDINTAEGSPYINIGLKNSGNVIPVFKFFPRIGTPVLIPGDNPETVYVTVNDHTYAFYAPTGATWKLHTDNTLQAVLSNNQFAISVAVLPDARESTKKIFKKHAGIWFDDTDVQWSFNEKSNRLQTIFTAHVTNKLNGSMSAPLLCAYPHQYKDQALSAVSMTDLNFENTVRGELKLFVPNNIENGFQFKTTYTYPGILPYLPLSKLSDDKQLQLNTFINQYKRSDGQFTVPYSDAGATLDTYGAGRRLNKMVQMMNLAEEVGDTTLAKQLLAATEDLLQRFLNVNYKGIDKYFYYDESRHSLIGYPSGFGSAKQLNDHHFHYGYFIYAAAQVAMRDKVWAKSYAPMVNLLIKELVDNPTIAAESDPAFPQLRYFDSYAGHSWASGDSINALGPNQESSSEAMNAWAGIILWGGAIGDVAVRDTGIYLYTTELNALQNYWFNPQGDVLDKDYVTAITQPGNKPAPYASIVLAGGYQNTTFFGTYPTYERMINVLPLTGASLYLASDPQYIESNYQEVVSEVGSQAWPTIPVGDWQEILQSYRALVDPINAENDFMRWTKLPGIQKKSGETFANTFAWMLSLQQLGTPVFDDQSDTPFYAVFKNSNGLKTYVAYNMTNKINAVTFVSHADGQIVCRLSVPAHQMRASNKNCMGQ